MKAGWQTKQLGDICRLIGGGTPSKDKMEYYAGVIPWATVRDMRSEVITKTECKITREAVKSSATNVIPKGNVVIATRVGLGKVCLLGQNTAINQDLRGIVPIDPKILSVRFLFWWLISIKDSIVAKGTGATVQGVKLPFVRSLQAPVPLLPEQRRIVGILDEAFEGIATAKANAEKNLQNARAVFESHLNAVFTQCGKGWVKKKLVDVAESISTGPFGTMLHKSDYISNGIPVVNPINLVESRIVPSSRMMVSTETRERLCSYVLQTGDVVIGRRGDLGRCALVTETEAGWLCGTGSFFLRLSKAMDGKYFVALFSSKQFRKRLENSAVGTTMSNLNHSILKELLMPVPPIADQKSIMARADEMLCEVARLESIYQQNLSALEELKKSLLHQAFTGAL